MAGHVYRRFNPREDISSTRVHAQPHTLAECSQSAGGVHVWLSGASGTQEFPWLPENDLSLYGGVRSRTDVSSGSVSGLQVYPVDIVDTHSIDKVVGIPGQYPQTGSINLVFCTDVQQPDASQVTDTRWWEEHWAVISATFLWYGTHTRTTYPTSTLPSTITLVHIPEMFYGRQIVTGSVYAYTRAWETASGSNIGSGTRYWVDDGLGRLFDVPSASIGDWKSAWMSGSASLVGNVFYNEGLIVLTNPSATWHNEFWSGSYHAQSQFASGSFTLTGTIVAGVTASVSGVQFVSITGTTTGTLWNTGSTLASGAANLATVISGNIPSVVASASGNIVSITASQVGAGGNSISLSSSSGSVSASAATLLGGSTASPAAFHLEFDGSTIMQSMVFMCRLAPGEANGSNNPSYSYTDAAGKVWAKSSGSNEGHTYITAVGIYNEERQLVAVAKMAQPIRKRERDNLDIRLKLDI